MTRFARASGSKASNERVEEDADSWSEMKKQIADKNQEEIEDKKQEKANKARMSNYKKFLEDEKDNKTQEWCDFSDSETKSPNKKGKANKKNESLVKKEDSSEQEDDTSEQEDVASEQEEEISKQESDSGSEPETQTIEKSGKSIIKKNNKQDKAISKKAKNVTNEPKPKKGSLEAKIAQQQNKPKKAPFGNTPVQYNKKGKPIKTKTAKPRDNLQHQPRKPDPPSVIMVINGKQVEVKKFEGFPVMMADYKRLETLKKSMISKGIPKDEVNATMKLERRKAEKVFAREKKKVCFHCRKSGHILSECPEIGSSGNVQTSGTGICFKCGSGEHTHFECKVQRQQVFKFAECFVCKEQGHIARQCPDNPKGMYPKGGACNVCGDVTHMRKDCPQHQKETEDAAILLPTSGDSVEGIREDIGLKRRGEKIERKAKIVKF